MSFQITLNDSEIGFCNEVCVATTNSSPGHDDVSDSSPPCNAYPSDFKPNYGKEGMDIVFAGVESNPVWLRNPSLCEQISALSARPAAASSSIRQESAQSALKNDGSAKSSQLFSDCSSSSDLDDYLLPGEDAFEYDRFMSSSYYSYQRKSRPSNNRTPRSTDRCANAANTHQTGFRSDHESSALGSSGPDAARPDFRHGSAQCPAGYGEEETSYNEYNEYNDFDEANFGQRLDHCRRNLFSNF